MCDVRARAASRRSLLPPLRDSGQRHATASSLAGAAGSAGRAWRGRSRAPSGAAARSGRAAPVPTSAVPTSAVLTSAVPACSARTAVRSARRRPQRGEPLRPRPRLPAGGTPGRVPDGTAPAAPCLADGCAPAAARPAAGSAWSGCRRPGLPRRHPGASRTRPAQRGTHVRGAPPRARHGGPDGRPDVRGPAAALRPDRPRAWSCGRAPGRAITRPGRGQHLHRPPAGGVPLGHSSGCAGSQR